MERLYELPLDEFVAARNQLAKERKDPALRKLRKPSVAAAAVNRLARDHHDLVRSLVDAGQSVRAAQQRALSGARTGGADLRDATSAHRAAVDALVAALPEASASVAERVRSTLAAASIDGDLVDDLVAGRLTDDVAPAGFGDLAGLEVLLPEPDEEEEEEADERAEERAAAEHALEEARAALGDARDREAKARAALDRAYDATRDAERAVTDAERRVADLR